MKVSTQSLSVSRVLYIELQEELNHLRLKAHAQGQRVKTQLVKKAPFLSDSRELYTALELRSITNAAARRLSARLGRLTDLLQFRGRFDSFYSVGVLKNLKM